ncbi:hypothetical protein L9F63_000887, partial [Diploptera punctata]
CKCIINTLFNLRSLKHVHITVSWRVLWFRIVLLRIYLISNNRLSTSSDLPARGTFRNKFIHAIRERCSYLTPQTYKRRQAMHFRNR